MLTVEVERTEMLLCWCEPTAISDKARFQMLHLLSEQGMQDVR